MDTSDFRQSVLIRLVHETLTTKLHVWFRLSSFPFEAVLPFVPREGVVYDVGCGFGILSYLLGKAYPRRRVIAYDPSAEKIKVARRLLWGLGNVTVLEASDSLPNTAPRPTVVVLLDVLYLLPVSEKRSLLGELIARLRPGGRLLVSIVPKETALRYFLAYIQELFMVRVFDATKSSSGVVQFETREQMRRLLREAGCKRVRVHHLPSPFPFFHKHLLFVSEK